MKKVLLGLLLAFSTQSFAGSHAFDGWRSNNWKKLGTESYYIDSARKRVNVTYFTDKKDARGSEVFFEEVAEATYHLLGSRVPIGAASRYGRCNSWDIVIYDLPFATVNDRRVMYWYPWKSLSQNIYGAYDSVNTSSKNTVAIVISRDAPNKKVILAHELTHYWYDMCLGGGEGVGESHAAAAEALYR